MTEISIVGLDLAKGVFQVHGLDSSGAVVVQRRLRRRQVVDFFERLAPCVVGMEACGSAHHWARTLQALGHDVRLMPASHVKPFAKRGRKNDATDAAAICLALRAPGMTFVPVKSTEQQAVLMLHRTRGLLVRQSTMLANALRGHLAEFGIVAPQGEAGLNRLIVSLDEEILPEQARAALAQIAVHLKETRTRIAALERETLAWHRTNAESRRLATIPGVGPLTASLIVATVGDVSRFQTGRDFAAWLGLVPSQHSSGNKIALGPITKMGDRAIRSLLVLGATSMLRRRDSGYGQWLNALLARKPARLASIALANKMARIAWAILTQGGIYQRPDTVNA